MKTVHVLAWTIVLCFYASWFAASSWQYLTVCWPCWLTQLLLCLIRTRHRYWWRRRHSCCCYTMHSSSIPSTSVEYALLKLGDWACANNVCESQNISFKPLVGHAHPSICTLINVLHPGCYCTYSPFSKQSWQSSPGESQQNFSGAANQASLLLFYLFNLCY